ncbi:MAG: NapC/NirT family cytochrome c [Nitrosomonadales bacterium]|nr:NapC/NirT family cytochrome c [Nitrosomonadales bacterium]
MVEKQSVPKRIWNFLKQPSATYSVLAIVVSSIVAGVIFWGGFNTAMEATNGQNFCISCHEMRDNVYAEFKKTVHYSNRVGVRATCPDCHVPRDWGYKLVRKVQASRELWGKLAGNVDTPEKFEEHRMEMANREWARMKESDSRECRNCHSFDAMRESVDTLAVYEKHMKADALGRTCIDCHKGIAHLLPREYVDLAEQ